MHTKKKKLFFSLRCDEGEKKKTAMQTKRRLLLLNFSCSTAHIDAKAAWVSSDCVVQHFTSMPARSRIHTLLRIPRCVHDSHSLAIFLFGAA